ncbi:MULTISPECIES: GCN5 family acetyltransferase [unclassified Mycobacterium]|uniref:GNAT family N-acetyltransferase, cg3035/Rv0428c family n=1 Tax=unclassified Mycobacterium TaxID=2642494 RepID=UPI0007FE5D3F|nr:MULTISPECIES: GCN5 family acetyltransferase [unclassified Mycobacterium]OBH01942.1 GCN5 family acetyltransferase [Mycobacterium sp. E2699]OBI50607.1 GCN5 family acetyltransferase [Mycobacterium sp. E787]
MVSWPALGTRVTVRYRRPAGSVPPLTDAVGHLLAVDPLVRVRTKTGAEVQFPAADVVALRALTDAPVRTSDIRALEHAAATARPGAERVWLDGWLLRAGHGAAPAANSAVPLDVSARWTAIPEIVAWYELRGLAPRLAIPERLLSLPPGVTAELTEQVLVRDLAGVTPGQPDRGTWRATVTDAPDGTRWLGLSAPLREGVLAWGASRGATRAYVELADGDTDTIGLAESLGFRPHHRRRYIRARRADTV